MSWDISKYKTEPWHSVSFKGACVPSEASDQPAHLIRAFAGHYVGRQGTKASVGSKGSDLSLRRMHMQPNRKWSAPVH